MNGARWLTTEGGDPSTAGPGSQGPLLTVVNGDLGIRIMPAGVLDDDAHGGAAGEREHSR
jgi:hypothetical protein